MFCPLFPVVVKIDAVKDAICQSLEDYNKQIDQLKSKDAICIAEALIEHLFAPSLHLGGCDQLKTEMEDATSIADALRQASELGACLVVGL